MKLRITVQGKSYDVDVEVLDGAPAAAAVAPSAPAAPMAPRPQPKVAPIASTGEKVSKAPIPGTIVGVRVKVGDTVKAGDALVVLEAMKMETNIASPSAGVVKDIKVKVGQVVKQGEVLVELE